MSINSEYISTELGNIIDPELNIALMATNSIGKVDVSDKTINIEIQPVGPIQWVKESINNLAIEVLKKIAPDYTYNISITDLPVSTDDRTVLKGVKNIIAVASGKGGVGKSAISANLAAGLSLSGAKVGLLDGDIFGPSLPTMFGLKDKQFEAEQNEDGTVTAYPQEKYGIKLASMGFVLNRDDAAIVRGPMLAGYFTMLFEKIEWGELDFLVLDLPPGTGDVQLTMTQRLPLSGAVVITTPQEIALADVRRSISMFRRVNVDILGIVENMSYFEPEDMPGRKYYIFGEGGGKSIAEENDVQLLGEVPIDINFRNTNDGGMPLLLQENYGAQGKILVDIVSKVVKGIREANYKKLSTPEVQISL